MDDFIDHVRTLKVEDMIEDLRHTPRAEIEAFARFFLSRARAYQQSAGDEEKLLHAIGTALLDYAQRNNANDN